MNRLFIVHCGNEPDNQTPPIWTDSYESAWHILAETTGEGVTKTELESHGYAIHEFVEAPDYDRGWLERMSEAIYECSKNPTCPVAFRRAMIVAEEKASWKDDRPKGEQKNPSAAEFNGVYQNWVHVLSLIAQTGERVLGEGFMERNGGAEDAPEQILAALEETARRYRELVPKEPWPPKEDVEDAEAVWNWNFSDEREDDAGVRGR